MPLRSRPLLAVAFLALLNLGNVALGQVALPLDIVLAKGEGRVVGGRAVLAAGEPGKVDIAWADKDGSARYTFVDLTQRATREGKVIDDEFICGLTHHMLGVGRDSKGVVRFGANNTKQIIEWTRSPEGKWTASDTKTVCAQYYGPVAAYTVGAKGEGAFFVLDEKNQALAVTRNPAGEWASEVLAKNLDPVTRAAATTLSDGTPIVAFQRLDSGFNLLVGPPAALTTLPANANRYFPLAIVPDAADNLHLVIAQHTGSIRYFRSTNKGKSFTDVAELAKSANYGDSAYLAAAVSPDGKRLAAVLPTGKSGLELVTLRPDGTRVSQELPGGKTQQAAIGYDKAGELYVVYYNDQDKALHLLSTAVSIPAMPKP